MPKGWQGIQFGVFAPAHNPNIGYRCIKFYANLIPAMPGAVIRWPKWYRWIEKQMSTSRCLGKGFIWYAKAPKKRHSNPGRHDPEQGPCQNSQARRWSFLLHGGTDWRLLRIFGILFWWSGVVWLVWGCLIFEPFSHIFVPHRRRLSRPLDNLLFSGNPLCRYIKVFNLWPPVKN